MFDCDRRNPGPWVFTPREDYMPAITEELIRIVTEVLNAVAVDFHADLPEIVEMFESPGATDSSMLSSISTPRAPI